MAEILHQLRLVVYPIIYRVSYIPGGCLRFQPSTVLSRILLLWPSCRFPKHQIECWRCEEKRQDTPGDHQSPSVLIDTPRNGIHTGIHVGAFLKDSKNVRKMSSVCVCVCVSTFGNLRSISFCYSRKNEQFHTIFLLCTVQFEKKSP